MIRLRQLEALSYVLSSRTMTAASELFGITQPAMSRLIMQLEEEVGCQLLRRDRGHVSLTNEGTRFYEKAERVLALMRELGNVAESLRKDPRGEVRIISSFGLINSIIASSIAPFSAANPQIKISIDVFNRARLEEAIHERKFDIALATLPLKAPASLTIDTLGTLPAVCIVPAKHPLARKRIIHAADLANVPFISALRETLVRHRVDDRFDKLKIKRILRFECPDTDVLYQMVGAGLGVSIVHPFILKPASGLYVCRAFEPSIQMEYAMFRQPKGEISTGSKLLAEQIIAATGHLRGVASPEAAKRKINHDDSR